MGRSARGSSKRGPLNSRASESGRPPGSASEAATPRSGEESRAGGSDAVGEGGIAVRRVLSSAGDGGNPGGESTQAPAGEQTESAAASTAPESQLLGSDHDLILSVTGSNETRHPRQGPMYAHVLYHGRTRAVNFISL